MTTPPPGSTAADRLLSGDARSLPLPELPLDPATVLADGPVAGLHPLTELGSAAIGVWELSPGTVTDVEADEVFVVLAGAGTLTFADGSALELRPGTVVRLHAGDRTRWAVRETLRKLYVT